MSVDALLFHFKHCTIPRLYLYCWGPAINWYLCEYCATKPEVENLRWWPLPIHLYPLQTRHPRDSNGYIYVLEVQHFIETHGNTVQPKCTTDTPMFRVQQYTEVCGITVRPNRKWKNPWWRPLKLNTLSSAPDNKSAKFQWLYTNVLGNHCANWLYARAAFLWGLSGFKLRAVSMV